MNEVKQIIQNIRNRVFHPVYLLVGEEPYFIDLVSREVEACVLEEQEKEFNQIILYGHDIGIQDLIGTVRRYPMMASHMVVVVREAQKIEDIEDLQPYVEKPLQSTVLVLCYKYKKLDKRRAFYKAVQKCGVVFESLKLKDQFLPGWIATYVRERGYQISEKNCMLISENLGNDLGKISNELDKVFISLKPGMQITADTIERCIGISKDYNIFELQRALGVKDVKKATQIILYYGDNLKEHPMPVIIAVLYSYFSKLLKLHFIGTGNRQEIAAKLGVPVYYLGEYQQAARNYTAAKVIRIIEHLRLCDTRSKGIGNISADHGELLKELAFKILH